MKVLVITGSLSERSMNKRVARYLERTFGHQYDISHFDLKAIPFYNQDIEGNPPQEILEMREEFAAADALVVISPEYNHSIPGVLKNMLDWASRGVRALKDKPILLASASQGQFAGIRAQIHLVQIMNSPGVEAKPFKSQIMIPMVQDKFAHDGTATDQATADFINTTFEKFIKSIPDSQI